ncbi:MAG: hypothetical protein V9G20_21665 [Candidatus Promineifilaceae bacterium]
MPLAQWWERNDLAYQSGRLHLAGNDLQTLAWSAGTPTFVYNATRVGDNLKRLAEALTMQAVSHKIFYALKANRFLPLVTYLKLQGRCGLDVCSPGELRLARQIGFAEQDITYTNTSVSDYDLDVIARHPQVHVNCDALSTIRRLGQRCPGRTIGLRINPQVGAGYHAGLHYSGQKATKFGLYPDRFAEALTLARQYDLQIKTLHFHFGSGYLTAQLEALAAALQHTHWFLDQCPTIDTLDIGGGLGLPLVPEHQPLDLSLWSQLIAQHAQQRNLTIHVEPGDYLVKDAGVLLVQVNSVEEKGGTLFVGVNAGFNLQNLAVYYQTPFVVTPLCWDETRPQTQLTIAGNINEAIDVLATAITMPLPAEGDYLALLNVGGYGASSSSNHCMRGVYSEYLVTEGE